MEEKLIKTTKTWNDVIVPIKKKYQDQIKTKLEEIRKEEEVFPLKGMFKLFSEDVCPFSKIKFLIVAPYPEPNIHSDGLAFSSKAIEMPETTKMFLKLVFNDVFNYMNEKKFDTIFQHGNLESWAKQGICLLNSSLTMSATKKTEHKELWHNFTKDVCTEIAKEHDFLAVILFGNSTVHLEELFHKKYHAVWKVSGKSFLESQAFGKAYEWYDRVLYEVINKGLADEEYFDLIKKEFNYKEAVDMDKFIGILKKYILNNQIPYTNGKQEIQKWREMSLDLFQWHWRTLFDLTLIK